MPPITVIDGIITPFLRDTDIGVRKQKFSHTGVKGKTVNPLPGTENQHCGRPIQDIARCHLFAAWLQNFLHANFASCPGRAAQNGEDSTNIDIDIYVGRPIQRIKDQDIVTTRELRRNTDKVCLLLGAHGAKCAATLHAVQHDAVGNDVHFLDIFALHIDFPSPSKDVQ